MRPIFGLLLIIFGVCTGVYCGIWWAFIGGIVDIIREIRTIEMSALGVACGVAKVFFSGVIGYLSAAVFILPGWILVH